MRTVVVSKTISPYYDTRVYRIEYGVIGATPWAKTRIVLFGTAF